MAKGSGDGGIAVIGLGRFGQSLALELMEADTEVLGIDASGKTVQALSGRLTHVVEADSTDEEALRQLSVHEFDRVVIGIGTDLEASILTASVVLGFGVPHIWAKAISYSHARILSQLGVHHVVRPEHDMGKRVAHLGAAGCSTTSSSRAASRWSRRRRPQRSSTVPSARPTSAPGTA